MKMPGFTAPMSLECGMGHHSSEAFFAHMDVGSRVEPQACDSSAGGRCYWQIILAFLKCTGGVGIGCVSAANDAYNACIDCFTCTKNVEYGIPEWVTKHCPTGGPWPFDTWPCGFSWRKPTVKLPAYCSTSGAILKPAHPKPYVGQRRESTAKGVSGTQEYMGVRGGGWVFINQGIGPR